MLLAENEDLTHKQKDSTEHCISNLEQPKQMSA